MAAKVKAWMVHGRIERSGWCDRHAMPHVFSYNLYRLTENGVEFLKTVTQCDVR